MRWHPKPAQGSDDMPWWLWVFVPIWGPFVACLFSMFGLMWLKRWLIGPSDQWRPWFAWYPVTIKQWPDEERAWLEWVERRAGHFLGDAVYRPAPASTAEGEG